MRKTCVDEKKKNRNKCLKCLYHNDLIFREVIMALEETLNMEKDKLLDPVIGVDVEKDSDKEFSWDSILDDDDDVDDDNETNL